MAVRTKTHPNEDAARRVVRAGTAVAEPRGDILLLTGCPLRDTRRQAAGGFAGPVRPDAPVGTYSGHIRRRHQGAGSFATGSFAGDTDRRRMRSFGDIERAEIVTHKDHGTLPIHGSGWRPGGASVRTRASEGERDARARLARDAL